MNPLDPTVNVATLQCVLTPLDPSHADVLLDQLETLSQNVSKLVTRMRLVQETPYVQQENATVLHPTLAKNASVSIKCLCEKKSAKKCEERLD